MVIIVFLVCTNNKTTTGKTKLFSFDTTNTHLDVCLAQSKSRVKNTQVKKITNDKNYGSEGEWGEENV
jgi:uncharacterized membrane protein required for colicin V production